MFFVQILSYIHLTPFPVPATRENYFRYLQESLFNHQLISHQITCFRDCKRSRLISTGFENKLSTSIPSMKCYLEKISKETVPSGSWSLCVLKLSRCGTPVARGLLGLRCFQSVRQNKDTILGSRVSVRTRPISPNFESSKQVGQAATTRGHQIFQHMPCSVQLLSCFFKIQRKVERREEQDRAQFTEMKSSPVRLNVDSQTEKGTHK